MPNYHMWCNHREVEPPTAAPKTDGNEDEDQMDDMTTDTRREYDLDYGEQVTPLDVQNFYRLFAASDEKMHDGTDVTVLQVVTHIMPLKSKYNFSTHCYNDIIKLIIDLVRSKHNMSKDIY
jgi:hypothetical protein